MVTNVAQMRGSPNREQGPFSLAGADHVRAILDAAGWTSIELERLDAAELRAELAPLASVEGLRLASSARCVMARARAA